MNKLTKLALDVSHDKRGDGRLLVSANGKVLKDVIVGPQSVTSGWLDLEIDLTEFKGQKVNIELVNSANNWAWEFGCWSKIAVLTD